MTEVESIFHLWDDNPASDDLLGFDVLLDPLLSALEVESIDPVTLGIHGDWGSGKSTILQLVNQALRKKSEYVVVTVNPWEFDDVADVRGTLIAQVLAPLIQLKSDNEPFQVKASGLLKRISWARVGTVMANGAMGNWDIEKLVDAFRPDSLEGPDSMSGFRLAFADLLGDLENVTRVVVLVDDLDRCLPDAVLATLEAIKLFLGVPKMAFILAADTNMVRDAIGGALVATGRSDLFAERYLDKIIQIPVSLPSLSAPEAEHYVGMLLSQRDCSEDDKYQNLVVHVNHRRREGKWPLLEEIGEQIYRPPEWIRTLSAQITQGLSSNSIGNPREIKRFLNAFGVRSRVANVRGVNIAPNVLVKLLILEDRYPEDFQRLASCPNTEQSQLVQDWEVWAADASNNEKPANISEQSADWARAEPSLSDVDITRYMTLAAALSSTQMTPGLDDSLVELFNSAVSDSQAARNIAVEEIVDLPVLQQQAIAQAIVGRVRRAKNPEREVEVLIRLASAKPDNAKIYCQHIKESCWDRLTPRHGLLIAGSPASCMAELATEIVSDDTVPEPVRESVRQSPKRS